MPVSRPYVERFFGAVPAMVALGEQELKQEFAESMCPATVHDPAVLAQTKAFLAAHHDLSDNVRKPIVNDADELSRALATRAAK